MKIKVGIKIGYLQVMVWLLHYIRNNFKIIFVIFLFFITALLIVYIFPRQGKFRYEYQKGSPWRHEDLQAEFDFPINKSSAELAQERDSALADFKPYFTYNSSLGNDEIIKFREDFEEEWITYSVREFNIKNADAYLNPNNFRSLHKLEETFRTYLATQLENIYKKGIIDLNDAQEVTGMHLKTIMLVKGNIAEQTAIDAVLTPKSAYEFLKSNLSGKVAENRSGYAGRYKLFFEEFDLNRYIAANIVYDELKSRNVKNSILNEISPFRGRVQEGQRIISKGELITPEKYQILESLRLEYESRLGFIATQLVGVGKFILVFSALFMIFLFLYNLRREILFDSTKSLFILLIVIIVAFVASTISKSNQKNFYIIPFTILPIVLRTFYDERLALFIHFIITLLVGFLAPNSFEFVFLTFIAGIIAVFSLTNFYRRSRIVITAALVLITYCIVYFGISILQEGNIRSIDYNNFKSFGINSFLILLSFPLIYIFEKTFGFLSDATLMELADTNQPLLRQLAEKAPGTFQHSLQVANLAEDAIFRIGGNPLLVRTGALYHDIGKMENPIYFIENQTSGINPHDSLSFEESARLIIDHVNKGMEIAKKNKLPLPLIDFIRTHHGTSTVQYFYRSYIKKYPEEEVDVKRFMYPGPKPFSKETAVMMMADSVEAASRSLRDINAKALDSLVDAIIDAQLLEEQFSNTDITFKDITTIKEVFKNRLRNIYHVRISYPV